jgi:phage-related protein
MNKNQYEIEFYKDNRSIEPAKNFLLSIPKKAQAKFFFLIDLLKENGPELKRPYADILKNGIYELRVEFQKSQYRILFFFIIGKYIYLSHGFIKKQWKVPNKEIVKAKNHKEILEKRRKEK